MKQAKIIQVGLTNLDKIKLDQKKPVDFTPEEAIFLLVEVYLSKMKYSILRQVLKQKNINVLPSHDKLIEERSSDFLLLLK